MQNCLKNGARVILLSDWECPEIVDREKQREEINEIISSLINEERPPIAFIYGASGSGKTFVVKKIFEEKYYEIKKHLPGFNYFYINCRSFGIPSLHSLWVFLANKLSSYLPYRSKYFKREIRDIPVRGWTTDEYMIVVGEIIKEKKLMVLLILDEVDKLDLVDVESLIYQIIGINENLPKYVGLSAILISNKISLLSSFSKSTFDRIGIKIHFTSYGVNDLFQILKVHAKYALKENSYDDRILLQIAKKIHEISNSAREAKIMLYNLAKISSSKLNLSLLDRALDETKKDLLREEILTRPLHHKFALIAVVNFQKRINRIAMYERPGLFKYTSNLPTRSNIYKEYTKICKEFGEQPKSYRTFFEIINDLEKYGLIKTEVVSLGRARGVTTLLRPPISIEILEPLVKEAVGI